MTLKVDIKYKSNAQQGALKGQLVRNSYIWTCELNLWTAKRKNKWICALKAALLELKIYGPSGNPNPKPSTSRYTIVPWELISEQDRREETGPRSSLPVPVSNWHLTDSNTALVDGGGDVFDEGSEVSNRNVLIRCCSLKTLSSFECVTRRGEPIAQFLTGTIPQHRGRVCRRRRVSRCLILCMDTVLGFLPRKVGVRRLKCTHPVPLPADWIGDKYLPAGVVSGCELDVCNSTSRPQQSGFGAGTRG